MKVVEVREQVRPPLKRCVELVLSGIKYRIFRAAITVAIIALAVAFLMTMLSESLITRRVAEAIDIETAPRRLLQFWVGRLSTAPDPQQLNEILAGLTAGSDRWNEIATWGKLDESQLAHLVQVAKKQQVYMAFFDKLTEEDPRRLADRRRGEDIFAGFVDETRSQGDSVQLREKELAALEKNIGLVVERFPASFEEFKAFLREWHATRGHRTTIIEAHKRAIANLTKPGGLLYNRRPTEFLATADADALKGLASENIGFRLSAAELETIRREAALSVDADRIQHALGSAMLKAMLAKRRGEDVSKANAQMLFQELQSADGAKFFVELTDKTKDLKLQILTVERIQAAAILAMQLAARRAPGAAAADPTLLRDAESLRKIVSAPLIREEFAKHKRLEDSEVTPDVVLEEISKQDKEGNREGATWLSQLLGRITPMEPLGLPVQRVQEVAKTSLAKSRLAQTEASVAQTATRAGFMGFSSRTIWLLVVSFGVCVVGIANAMLMSVTERFREIATMKCLGATDGFIMLSFVLESCMQGVVGSAMGLALGFVLGMLRTWAMYGRIAMEHMPALGLLVAGGVSLGLGILISALAAVYPAWVAARLAPMEAMRIE